MTNIIHPKWRSTWLVHDPDWVVARKKEWLQIKKSVVFKNMFKKYEMEKIETFFMTGSAYPYDLDPEDWEWFTYHPETSPLPVRCSVLLQCWLAPTVDLDHWAMVKRHNTNANGSYDRYTSSRSDFRLLLKEKYPESGTLFNGRDAELYKFFVPTRLVKGGDLFDSDERFNSIGSLSFYELIDIVGKYLRVTYNTESIAPIVLPEWCDSIIPAFLDCENESHQHERSRLVVSVFNSAMERIVDAKASGSEQIDFAKNMVKLLQKVSFPDEMEVVKRNFEKLSKVLN